MPRSCNEEVQPAGVRRVRCGLVPSVEMKSFSDHRPSWRVGSKCLVRAAVISASANSLLNRVYVVGPIVVKSAGALL